MTAVAGVLGVFRKFDGDLRRELFEIIPGADLRRVDDDALAVFGGALARILPARSEFRIRRLRAAVSAVVAGRESQAVSETRKSASQIPFKRIVFILEDAARKARQFSRTSCAHSFVFGAERKLRARGASSPRPEKNLASRVDGTRKFSAAVSSPAMGLPARRYWPVQRLPAIGKIADAPIVSLNAPIISYHETIVLLSASNVSVFHVEQSRIADELGDLRLERCDPELGWHLTN
jgi:hypothetical protein